MNRLLTATACAAALLSSAMAAPAFAAPGSAADGLEAMRELNLIVLGDQDGYNHIQGKAFIGGYGAGEFGAGSASNTTLSSRPTVTIGGDVNGTVKVMSGMTPAGAVIGGTASSMEINAPNATIKVGGALNTGGGNGAVIEVGGALNSGGSATGVSVTQGLGTGAPGSYGADLKSGIAAEAGQLLLNLKALSSELAAIDGTTLTYGGDQNWSFTPSDPDGDGFAVYDIDGGDAFFNLYSNLSMNIPVVGGVPITTIINVRGSTSYDMSSGFNFNGSGDVNRYVIWNFIDATSIKVNQWHGAILAPLAKLTNTNDLNGSIAVASMDMKGEVHLGTYNGTDSFLPEPPVSPGPEPATWAMMLVGFVGMGAALRRRRMPIAA